MNMHVAAEIPPSKDRAAMRTWNGRAIGDQINSKTLGAAHRQWLFHRATSQPRLKDLTPHVSDLHDDTLLAMKSGQDHLIVGQSVSYIRNVGRDLRGSLSSELNFATANSLRDLFDQTLATKQPIYARYISSLSKQNVYWEALILPLSADGRAPPTFTLTCLAMLNEKVDLLQILYDRSPVGVVAAVPIMDGQNRTDDARILTMNAAARQILALDGVKHQPNSVGDLIRYVSTALHWTPRGTKTDGHLTTIGYRTADGAEFDLTIELIEQFLLICIAPHARSTDTEQSSAGHIGRLARLLGRTTEKMP